jgi:choloylglycine hydrolase
MNEKGLVANLLYLAEARYPAANAADKRPTLSIAAWVQYVLDTYATTTEAVEGLRKEAFRMVPILAPSGEPGTVHPRCPTPRATRPSSSTSTASSPSTTAGSIRS